jgi:hypothetical protein
MRQVENPSSKYPMFWITEVENHKFKRLQRFPLACYTLEFQESIFQMYTSYLYVNEYTKVVPKVMSIFILQRNEGIQTKTNDVSKI